MVLSLYRVEYLSVRYMYRIISMMLFHWQVLFEFFFASRRRNDSELENGRFGRMVPPRGSAEAAGRKGTGDGARCH